MKKMGRPKGNNNMERICTIRMDNNTLIRLEKYCEYMHIAKSEAIRVAINKMVDENNRVMDLENRKTKSVF
jgi:antitoxin component of RelBE/YafQ-DinJ toxin-antitoxin module